MAEETKTPDDEPQSDTAAAVGDGSAGDGMNGAGAADAHSESQEEGGVDTLDTLLAERDALKDQLLRALADVENMRRLSLGPLWGVWLHAPCQCRTFSCHFPLGSNSVSP